MRTQKTTVMTFLTMTGLALAGSKEPMPVVTIRVENEAQVDERIVREAQKEAVAILARAGVKLIWADCGRGGSDWESREACKHFTGPNEFWMQITMDRPHWSPKETLGFSDLAHGDGSGGVYYPAVLALVRDMRAEAPQLLAAAMVHEVGHLILGANAHTHAGVMCGNWSQEQYKLISAGRLDFAPGQPKMLQTEVKRRASEKQQRQQVAVDQQ